MMTTEEMQIHELAERAGVSVRTIRYYIEEGLLPDPKYQGKYSYYTPNFLDRLELIRRLKESYLPLREIRDIINSLTDEEVRTRLRELSSPSPKLPAPSAPHSRIKPRAKALDYIDRVMESQARSKQKGSLEKPEFPFPQDRNIVFPSTTSLPGVAEPTVAEDVWQRISLAPGVELHLRTPLNPGIQNRVQRLVDFAKKLFQDKS